MKIVECQFEADVLAAALMSGWPETAKTHIRDHIAVCASCHELATVASAVDELRDATVPPALPGADKVWWLARLRARREAAEAARRPIVAVQIVAGVCGACVVASIILTADVKDIMVAHWAIMCGLGAMLLLVPAAVLFAAGRD